jgi:hypothetical protein
VRSIFAYKERHKKEAKGDDKEKGEKEVSTNL